MKNIKYLILLFLSMSLVTACFDDSEDFDLNGEGPNVVTFDRVNTSLTAVTNGQEYNFKVKIKVVGPTVRDLKNPVSVTVETAPGTTATNAMYTIKNLPLVLSPENNYLGELEVVVKTAGQTVPQEGTPEYDAWVAPVLKLNLKASGDPMVIGSGKTGVLTINYSAPNPYAGDYDAHIIYRHPSAGTYPNNVYVDEVNPKTLTAVTGRKSETGFAIWGDTDICWITINADNSIGFVVADTWPYDVKLGDPNRPDLVSHFDPADGKIYLYYHYTGAGGDRVFWEVFTPKF